MKLTKIFSVVTCSALALAGAFMFTGCPDGNIGSDDISVTEGGAKASINATNESTKEFRRTLTKSSTFSQKEVTSTITFENQTSASNDGAMGVAFDYHTEKDDDGDTVYNFGVVAFRFVDSKLCTYISYYSNVGGDYLSGSTDNFCDKNGVKIGDKYASDSDKTYKGESLAEKSSLATEVHIIPTSGSWFPTVLNNKVTEDSLTNYYTYDSDKGTVTVVANIAVQEDGSFVVKIAKDKSSLSGTKDTDYIEYTVPTENTSVDSEKATSFAYYANVYGGKTLKGNWSTAF